MPLSTEVHKFTSARERLIAGIAMFRPLTEDERLLIKFYCNEVLTKAESSVPLSQKYKAAKAELFTDTPYPNLLHFIPIPLFGFLLPRCYQDRTTQVHLGPLHGQPALLFLVGLGCLSLTLRKFVNRRPLLQSLTSPDRGWLSLTADRFKGQADRSMAIFYLQLEIYVLHVL